jgi:hypothetical protein
LVRLTNDSVPHFSATGLSDALLRGACQRVDVVPS